MKILLSSLRCYWKWYIILVLIICIFISHNHNKSIQYKLDLAKADLVLQNGAIEQMKVESQKQAQRIELAQKEAQKVKVQYDTRIKQIMSVPVPTSCEEAMKWGIQQARLIQ